MASVIVLSSTTVNEYSNNSMLLIARSYEDQNSITAISQIYGVSAGAIGSAIAREWDRQNSMGLEEKYQNELQDAAARNLIKVPSTGGLFPDPDFSLSHEQLVAQYLSDYREEGTNSSIAVMSDIGAGNVKVGTAIRLIRAYVSDPNRNGDPLELLSSPRDYSTNYRYIIQDLAAEENSLTAKIYALMAKEAETFFTTETHAYGSDWANLPQEFKDALYLTYFTLGKTTIESRVAKSMVNGVYEPSPGPGITGGMGHLFNAEAIGSALGISGYGGDVVVSDMSQFLAQAESAGGIAYRYALYRLNAFVLPELDYSSRNVGGVLNLLDAEGNGSLSEEWFADRSAMLALITESDASGTPATSTTHYYDAITGKTAGTIAASTISRVMFGNESANSIAGALRDDHLYGGAGNDNLSGDDGNDYLEGGADNDVLNGGAGNDSLVGGTGSDRYEFKSGDGVDALIDSDGEGSIYIDGQLIAHGYHQQGDDANTYHSIDGALIFTASGSDLVITRSEIGSSDSITIRDYRAEDKTLGIELDGEATAGYNTPNLKDYFFSYLNRGLQTILGSSVPAPMSGARTVDASVESAYIQDSVGFRVGNTYGEYNDRLVYLQSSVEGIFGLPQPMSGDRSTEFGNLDPDYIDYFVMPEPGRTYYDDAQIYAYGSPDAASLIASSDGNNATSASVITWYTDASGLHLFEFVDQEDIEDLVQRSGTGQLGWGGIGTQNFVLGTGMVNSLRAGGEASVVLSGDGGDGVSGGHGNDYLAGGDGDDYVSGGGGGDLIFGESGDDALLGESGNDYIAGGAGADLLLGEDWRFYYEYEDPNFLGNFDDFLAGEDGKDVLIGDLGSDTLYGGRGDDELYGDRRSGNEAVQWTLDKAGTDYLDGGDGNDVVYGGEKSDTLLGGAGDDFLGGDEGADTLLGGSGNDALHGDILNAAISEQGDDFLDGGEGADILLGYRGNDILKGDAGNDSLLGHEGSDELAGGVGLDHLWGDEGNDTLSGDDDDDYLEGGAGSDQLFGGMGVDTLFGGEGDDLLDSGAGSDVLDGGEGNDTYVYHLGDAPLSGGNAESIHDDSGNNKLVLEGVALSDIQQILDHASGRFIQLTNGDQIALAGAARSNTTIELAGGWIDDAGNVNSALDIGYVAQAVQGTDASESIATGRAADTVIAGGGSDVITTLGDADYIVAGAGNDVIDAGAGDDIIYSETGDDLITAGDGSDQLIIDANSGHDTIDLKVGEQGSLAVDIRWLAALPAGNVVLAHPAANDVLATFADGSSLLLQNALATDAKDFQLQFADRTWDRVGLRQLFVEGGSGADIFNGSEAADTYAGMGGNDTLYGNGGNDTLDGGMGADTLVGGAGADTYWWLSTSGSDRIVETTALETDTLYFDDLQWAQLKLERVGNDLKIGNILNANAVTIADWFTFSDQQMKVENFVMSDGQTKTWSDINTWFNQSPTITLTDADETYTGDARAEMVYGAGGRDSLIGNGGNDSLYGQVGNDYLTGGDGNDSLDGGDGDDTLGYEYGTENGDDILLGGVGNDYLYGGANNDTYVHSAGDGYDVIKDTQGVNLVRLMGIAQQDISYQFVYSNYASADLVISIAGTPIILYQGAYVHSTTISTPSTLRLGIELDGGITITPDQILQSIRVGTASADWLYATDSGSTLDGLAGDDLIYGGASADTISGGAGADSINVSGGGADVVNGGAGSDTISGDVNDTAFYQRGNGYDRLNGIRNLSLDSSIGAADISYLRRVDDLVLVVNGSYEDAIVVGGHFSGTALNLSFQNGELAPSSYAPTGVYLDQSYGLPAGSIYGGPYDIGGSAKGGAAGSVTSGSVTWTGLFGTSYNDWLVAVVTGGWLEGFSGDDVLVSGSGADVMDGYSGADTYVFNHGFGVDLIDEYDSATESDRIVFGAGVDSSDILIGRSGSANMAIYSQASRSIVGVSNSSQIEFIEFADGTVWDAAQIQARFDASQFQFGNISLSAGAYGAVVNGTTGNDFIIGAAHNRNTLTGGDGNDHLIVLRGDGSTVNTATGGSGDDWIEGSQGNDNLVGDAGNDLIEAGAGNDTLYGGSGLDTLMGGRGDDFYVIDESGDVVVELASDGLDTVSSSVDYVLGDHLENLTLAGSASINATGNAANNKLTANSGSNVLTGGAGNDTYQFNGGTGFDVINNYDIDGVTNTDSVVLGAGFLRADVKLVRLANDLLILSGSDLIRIQNQFQDGSAAFDSLHAIDRITFNGGTTLLAADIAALMLSPSEPSELADILVGTNINDILNASGGNDAIFGMEGDDVLDGGAGSDLLIGGAGNDTYVVENAGDGIIEAVAEGTDTVVSAMDFTLASHLENLVLAGSAVNGFGNELNNIITGNAFDNSLGGQGGIDTLIGGNGSDEYFVTEPGDVVIEQFDEGSDTVTSWMSYALAENVENLYLMDSADELLNINGYGNAQNNSLIGNSDSNSLFGGAGDDVLSGSQYEEDPDGNDYLDGGDGEDELNGNAGNDTLLGGAAWDRLNGGDGDDYLDGGLDDDDMDGEGGNDTYVVDNIDDAVYEGAGRGTDTVQSSISYSLADMDIGEVENLTLLGTAPLNATGNNLVNIIRGNSGANIIDGGAGVDTLIGGAGNDSYVVDATSEVITENANEGFDAVNSSVTYALAANVENLTLTGAAAINGTGNTLDNSLTGNSAANTLTGGAGNDILDGGAGTDRLVGGTGNDSYYIEVSTDVIVENASEGTDAVFSRSTFTLGSNLENLTLTGSSAINGTGNTLVNIITGNTANNTLSGGTGADTLIGGLGSDSYMVDNVADVITENAGEGTDSVSSSVTYTLSANVENLTLSGTSAIHGTGNASNNTITGNSGANTLTGNAGDDVINGMTGADRMVGGSGDDTYTVDNASDVIVENASEGADTVNSSRTYTLGSNVENLILTGTSALNGTGNTLNNSLTGNSAANTLTGAAGDDVLNGLGGADRMVGGTGNDTYFVDISTDVIVENAGEGGDTINSAVTYTLGTNLENLTLTGSAAINGTGNSAANVLTGNGAANTLTGAAGNDTYVMGRGSAADTIIDTDSTAGNTDVLSFLSGVTTDQLWFRHVGNNLEVSIIGTSDSSTISNWYGGSSNHIEQFKTADGQMLLNSQVENLVSAMAAFSPPSAGQTTLPQNYQDQLGAVIAANWQ